MIQSKNVVLADISVKDYLYKIASHPSNNEVFATILEQDPQLNSIDSMWEVFTIVHRDCDSCVSLNPNLGKYVPGCGSKKAKVLLLGEAPGGEEDAQLVPFVGPAGEILNKGFKVLGIDRSKDVYITNATMCRPAVVSQSTGKLINNPNGPPPDQISMCKGRLLMEIGLVSPEFIVCLGMRAHEALLGSSSFGVGSMLRVIDTVEYSTFDGTKKIAKVTTTYHPSAIQYSSVTKEQEKMMGDIGWALKKAMSETGTKNYPKKV
jgi:uracil-DNA glycosylase family 4